ncbi:MAG: toxin [Rickettsiales bacterium]|nr:MAG: toxin [Rickettsiales bacterium]
MEVRLSKASGKYLKKLGSSKFAKQIAIKIKVLSTGHQNDTKKLKGNLSDYYRVDIGEYRIIYQIEGPELYISLIGKRNDGEVYKLMERKQQ